MICSVGPLGTSSALMSTRDRASTGRPPMASATSESTTDFPRGLRVRVRQDQSAEPARTRIEVLEPAGHPSHRSYTASASEAANAANARSGGADDSDGGQSDSSRGRP